MVIKIEKILEEIATVFEVIHHTSKDWRNAKEKLTAIIKTAEKGLKILEEFEKNM